MARPADQTTARAVADGSVDAISRCLPCSLGSEVFSELLRVAYGELHGIAERRVRGERRGHALEPGELLHEAYLRLTKSGPTEYQNKAHFFAVWSRSMYQILVEDARRAKAKKRGGGWQKVELEEVDLAGHEEPANLLHQDDTLASYARLHPHLGRIIRLRLDENLSTAEIAALLGMGQSTVRRDLAIARARLREELESHRG